MVLLSTPLPFLSCPFHSAGSSRTTYVPRASELVATAGRSLDYALSFFHHHLHIPPLSLFAIPPSFLPSFSLSLSLSLCLYHHYQPFSLSLSLFLYPSLLPPSILFPLASVSNPRLFVFLRQVTLSLLFYSLSSLLCALCVLFFSPTDFYMISSLFLSLVTS